MTVLGPLLERSWSELYGFMALGGLYEGIMYPFRHPAMTSSSSPGSFRARQTNGRNRTIMTMAEEKGVTRTAGLGGFSLRTGRDRAWQAVSGRGRARQALKERV